MPTRTAEVGVVGAGVIGLAAAEALTQAGVDVVCFDPQPGGGQSAGLTRVFRHVHDQAELVALAQEARGIWGDWGERAGTPLVGDEGVLFAGPGTKKGASLLASAGVQHRLVGEEEQRELLPALGPPAPEALFEAAGGAIRVRPTIEFLTTRLGRRLIREEVIALRPDGDGVTLFTPEGIWHFDRVVVCAGVRTHELARAHRVEIPVALALHVRVTYSVRPELEGRPLPCWYDRTGRYGPSVYAGPLGTSRYVVGVGTDDQVDGDPGIERSRRYVEQALPGLDPEPVAYRPCWLTVLPWQADAFAVWPAGPLLFFAGHNLFKFAPVLGRLLAGAARSGQIPPNLTPPR